MLLVMQKGNTFKEASNTKDKGMYVSYQWCEERFVLASVTMHNYTFLSKMFWFGDTETYN